MDIGFFVYKFRYCWKSATRHLRSDEQLGTSSAGAKLTINFAMLALKRHHTGEGGGGGGGRPRPRMRVNPYFEESGVNAIGLYPHSQTSSLCVCSCAHIVYVYIH